MTVKKISSGSKIASIQNWDVIISHEALKTRYCNKVMDDAQLATFIKIYHVIKYVIDARNFELKNEPYGNKKEPWNIICFCNNDYAGNTVTRNM